MKRAEGLAVLSRREVCSAFASCVGLVLVASCTDGDLGAIQTGPLGGPDGPHGGGPDGGMPPSDAHVPPSDSGSMATCPTSGATDVGMPSTFISNSPVYFAAGNFFVVRDSGGLYALTAKCTHEGATCRVQSGVLYCPRHGAEFTYNGAVISGPVVTGLVHYAMCTLGNGHVAVVTSQHVASSQRLVA